MRMLCVTSCTAKKAKVPRVAGVFYEGLQHKYVLEGIRSIRQTLGPESIDLSIISAKYGLLDELDIIEPYDVTFNDMKHDEIIKTARELNIHDDMQKKVVNYDIVFYLLGLNYLKTLELPFDRDGLTNHFFLVSPVGKSIITKFTEERRDEHWDHRDNYFTYDAGSKLSADFGVQNIALKGFVFKRLGEHFKEDYDRARSCRRQLMQTPELFGELIDYFVMDRYQKLAQAKEDASKQLELF